MICHGVFLKHFGMMGHDRLKKVVLVIFSQKFSFNAIMQFGPNMDQNYATLYPRQLYLMIHSLKIVRPKYYQLVNQTKIPLLAKGILAQFGPTLCFMIHSLGIFLKFFGIMRYKRQTKLALIIFPKITFWGNMSPIQPKIVQC